MAKTTTVETGLPGIKRLSSSGNGLLLTGFLARPTDDQSFLRLKNSTCLKRFSACFLVL